MRKVNGGDAARWKMREAASNLEAEGIQA